MTRELIPYGPSSSKRVGDLPEGCIRCINGEKIVLYTTGSCSVGCMYCPIPEDKKEVDSIYINERLVSLDKKGLETIIDESNLCIASGTGITGGDPMEVPERTISYIKSIRKEFGIDYHLHLYTSGIFFIDNTQLIDELFSAGLDELRFHPRNLKTKKVWEIARDAKRKYPDKSIGFEVPAISGREEDLIELIRYADDNGLDFVNLNEYEFTESNFNKLSQRGFVSVLSNAAVIGSEQTALEVMNSVREETKISLHFCSSGSKDSIQLVQRFKRRASMTKREFDHVSDDGLIEYGRLVLFSQEDFDKLKIQLVETFDLEDDFMEIFEDDLSVETADYVVASIIDELREDFDEIQAEIVSKHPIDNSPIIRIDPL